ncbi:cytochrome P450 2L1-like [Penaeus vannamei]|uniref:cytochrome P450 2L1-like n=1 Tax=Penaeus vannamei TaxID=6689 RepID=UPI00387F9A8F
MAKEAFTRPEFLNRPDWSIFKLMVSDNNSGVVGSSGATWHANRRFTLRQLRDLGMGKSRMVSVVQREAQCLAEELGKQAGRAAPVPHALTVCVLNVLWQLVASKRFSVDDPVILDLEGLIDDTLAKMARLTVPDFLPWLSRAFPLALQKRLFALDILEVMKDKFSRFCEELIDDHKQALDPSNPRDLIDAYLIDLQERRLIGEEETDRSKDLSKLVFDMFTAGSETTTNTLTWMLYYLAAFPDVQTKMQEEVDRVLPKDALPTLDDRPSLPYTEAVIHEVHRFASVTSMGVQHCATKDTLLAGYFIPKDAVLMSVVGTMHRDPRYWQDPDSFLPDRWLDGEGKFRAKQEGFLPFGVGKRRCVAESLVKLELLVFSCALVRRLRFSPPPGAPLGPPARTRGKTPRVTWGPPGGRLGGF